MPRIRHIIHDSEPVGVIGGAPIAADTFKIVASRVKQLVAADSGLGVLRAAGQSPAAVIGDFDSVDPEDLRRVPASRRHHIPEQDTTDFEKCLARIDAPLILAAGFNGGRTDHELAALHGVLAHPDKRCVLVASEDIMFLAPPHLSFEVPPDTRVSLMPLRRVMAESRGLVWPLGCAAAAAYEAGTRIAASNRADATGRVEIRCDRAGMLVILPRGMLDAVIEALVSGPQTETWPAPV